MLTQRKFNRAERDIWKCDRKTSSNSQLCIRLGLVPLVSTMEECGFVLKQQRPTAPHDSCLAGQGRRWVNFTNKWRILKVPSSCQTPSGQRGRVPEIQNIGLRSYTDTNLIQFRRFLPTSAMSLHSRE